LANFDAMKYKGTINSGSAVPSSGYKAGWVYKIINEGTYVGQQCEPGDLLVAIQNANQYQVTIIPEHWTVI